MSLIEIVKIMCALMAMLNMINTVKAKKEKDTDAIIINGFWAVIMTMLWRL